MLEAAGRVKDAPPVGGVDPVEPDGVVEEGCVVLVEPGGVVPAGSVPDGAGGETLVGSDPDPDAGEEFADEPEAPVGDGPTTARRSSVGPAQAESIVSVERRTSIGTVAAVRDWQSSMPLFNSGPAGKMPYWIPFFG
jgi:hypothetical protein